MVRAISLRLLPIAFSISFLLSRCLRATKSLISPAMRQGSLDASKAEIGPIALLPRLSEAQTAAASFPMGVSAPQPVITARRDCDMERSLVTRAAFGRTCLPFHRLQQILQFAAKDEVAVTERLLRARLVEMRKRDLR